MSMNNLDPLPVYVRNAFGAYLSGEGEHWQFTHDLSKAHVFDYFGDKVSVQLEEFQRQLGVIWVATPVEPELAHEKCDGCGIIMSTRVAHFDGARFLCPNCHRPA